LGKSKPLFGLVDAMAGNVNVSAAWTAIIDTLRLNISSPLCLIISGNYLVHVKAMSIENGTQYGKKRMDDG